MLLQILDRIEEAIVDALTKPSGMNYATSSGRSTSIPDRGDGNNRYLRKIDVTASGNVVAVCCRRRERRATY